MTSCRLDLYQASRGPFVRFSPQPTKISAGPDVRALPQRRRLLRVGAPSSRDVVWRRHDRRLRLDCEVDAVRWPNG